MSAEPFTGLSMPVFTAFGWAGEETAIQFALSQLDVFIKTLHQNLSREAQSYFPFFGLDKEARTVYIATQREPQSGIFITFDARPMSLDVRLNITDTDTLSKGLKAAEANIPAWHRYIIQLGEEWSLHVQQSQVDEETMAVSNYQDLFKDSVTAFALETCETVTSRAAFLNSEAKWVTPIYITHSIPSEQAANMKTQIVEYLSAEIDKLLSIVDLFQKAPKRSTSTRKKASPKTKPATTNKITATEPSHTVNIENDDQFTYVATLKPLHIRKGFINLTPQHWPFFALNARTGSRNVTLCYEGKIDQESSVWRLQPSDMARIVLSETAQEWFEDQFDTNDKIRVVVAKLPNEEIQVTLSALAE